MNTTIQDAVRAWANGVYAAEAGVELLIRQGKTIYEGAPWLIDLREDRALEIIGTQHRGGDRTHVAVDVDALLNAAGAWSGGEQRLVRIAASLLGGPAVDLSEELPGIDRDGVVLVLAAIAHAAGSHEHSGMKFNDDGEPVGFTRLESLYPWTQEG